MSFSRGRSPSRPCESEEQYNGYRRFSNYRSSSKHSPSRDRNVTNSIDVCSSSPSVYSVNNVCDKIWIELKVNGRSISFQMDTGATCSMIGLNVYRQLGCPTYINTTKVFRAYGGHQITVRGMCYVEVVYKNYKCTLPLIVVDQEVISNIMGIDWFEAFNFKIVHDNNDVFSVTQGNFASELKCKISQLCHKHQKLFENTTGRCTSYKAEIKLKADAEPRYFKPRIIPFAIQAAVKKELERLVDIGVLKPIQTTQWATPIVPVKKSNGEIRICADFKITVNQQIETDRHPIPRIDELFYRLQGGQCFTKIDLKDAYFQIELSEDTKKFMVVNTPFGLYQFQRLPFGIASAPGIFQRLMEQLTADLEFCAVYLDDIIISGKSNDEHLRNLEMLMCRLEENGFICRVNKCEFAKTEIEYLGHIIDKQGIRPSNTGLEAIKNLPSPRNLKEVESFIGKVNYYNKFIQNFSDIAAPLNKLRKKNVHFQWTAVENDAFQKLKAAIENAARLTHFRGDLPLILATDASLYGVGAVLSHRFPDGTEYHVAFASKTLDKAQQNYSQIEKEALSIIYGVVKFHQFLHGRRFQLVTDHKPLLTLFSPNKQLPIHSINRLQRWAIILMSYEYDIIYKPTHQHCNADALSRLPSGPDLAFDASDESCHFIDDLYQVAIENYPINASIIQQHTRNDTEMRQVIEYIKYGWPKQLPQSLNQMSYLSACFRRQDTISSFNDIIFLQTDHARVVIPPLLQDKTLELLHEGHWGITRMKQLARRYCWWPSIDTDIEKMVKRCDNCAINGNSAKKEFSEWPTPAAP